MPNVSDAFSGENELEQITTRLFRADLDQLRSEAERTKIPWQMTLRLLVNTAVHSKRMVG